VDFSAHITANRSAVRAPAAYRPRTKPFLATLGGALLILLSAPHAQGDVYRYLDRNGVTHFADRPLGPGYRRIIRTFKGWVPQPRRALANAARNRRKYAALIDRIAHRHHLDRALVHAVVTAESAYDPNAMSRTGAVGLMQLMPATARRYGVRNRRDPRQNVTGGVRYLRDLLRQFRNLRLALAAYNAGENAVLRYGRRIPPFPETRQYVRRVLGYYRDYRGSS